jgi:hypothetical protein
MTPAQAIAMLDKQLSMHGEPVTLRRGTPAVTLPTKAFVRGYGPQELVGTIQQGDSRVALSPSGLSGAFLAKLPARGDRIDIAGVTKTIEAAEIVRMGTTIVRVNLQIRG